MLLCADKNSETEPDYSELKELILSLKMMYFLIGTMIMTFLSVVSWFILTNSLVKMENFFWLHIKQESKKLQYQDETSVVYIIDDFDKRNLQT